MGMAAEDQAHPMTGCFFHDPWLVSQEDRGPPGISAFKSLPEIGAMAGGDPPPVVVVHPGEVEGLIAPANGHPLVPQYLNAEPVKEMEPAVQIMEILVVSCNEKDALRGR